MAPYLHVDLAIQTSFFSKKNQPVSTGEMNKWPESEIEVSRKKTLYKFTFRFVL
jgi:hypothetical protein